LSRLRRACHVRRTANTDFEPIEPLIAAEALPRARQSIYPEPFAARIFVHEDGTAYG